MALHLRQIEVLEKRRGRGQQKVTVEHVHVNVGGQAIVGNIEVADRKSKEAPSPAIAHTPGESIEMEAAARFKGGIQDVFVTRRFYCEARLHLTRRRVK